MQNFYKLIADTTTETDAMKKIETIIETDMAEIRELLATGRQSKLACKRSQEGLKNLRRANSSPLIKGKKNRSIIGKYLKAYGSLLSESQEQKKRGSRKKEPYNRRHSVAVMK